MICLLIVVLQIYLSIDNVFMMFCDWLSYSEQLAGRSFH